MTAYSRQNQEMAKEINTTLPSIREVDEIWKEKAFEIRIQHCVGLPETCYYTARQGDWRMCNVGTAFERNLIKLMNPKLRARRTKGKVYGDYCCELTIDWDPEFA